VGASDHTRNHSSLGWRISTSRDRQKLG
jgi:hypothetical protein